MPENQDDQHHRLTSEEIYQIVRKRAKAEIMPYLFCLIGTIAGTLITIIMVALGY